ncbi:MAG: thiamine pyrophosphate-dependent enzyme [Nocardioides sp.]
MSKTASPGPMAEPVILESDHRLELLRGMLEVRIFEERCVELYSAAKIRGFLHVAIGEEAVPVGVAAALDPEDAIVSTYREHGHALVRGGPVVGVLAAIYGKVTRGTPGRGGAKPRLDATPPV